MNLIPCGNFCKYQKDGYCQLNHPISVTGIAVKGCCYFVPINKAQNIKTELKQKADVQ